MEEDWRRKGNGKDETANKDNKMGVGLGTWDCEFKACILFLCSKYMMVDLLLPILCKMQGAFLSAEGKMAAKVIIG